MCLQRELPRAENDNLEVLLQLKLDREGKTLLGTSGNGFVVWEFGDSAHHPNKAVVLPLPHGVRNISTRVLYSNSCMISSARDYVIAGVRLTKCTRHTACTEPQCLYKGALYLFPFIRIVQMTVLNAVY